VPSPPPFVLPPDSWRARVRAMLAGPGRQGRGLAVVAILALVLAGVVWLRAQPRPVPADPPGGLDGLPRLGPGTSGPPAPGGQTDAGAGGQADVGAGGQVAVHVAGRVRRPGLVSLPAGSRVADALAAAGGPAKDADLDRLNLARRLRDGEQVLVLARGAATPGGRAPGQAGTGGAAGAGPGSDPAAPLDLNTATLEQLETLPGVGEVTAGRIVAYRERQPFRAVADLRQVEGIGERRLAALQGLVTVG
jgi:competence protein ComEA